MKTTTIIGEMKVDTNRNKKKGLSLLELMEYRLLKPLIKMAKDMAKFAESH